MGANDPRDRAIFDPRGMVGRIYKEDHYTLLHTKYESCEPCGFGEKIFLCFSHDAPEAGLVWTQGAQLAGFIKRFVKIFLCFSQCKPMGANDPQDSWQDL